MVSFFSFFFQGEPTGEPNRLVPQSRRGMTPDSRSESPGVPLSELLQFNLRDNSDPRSSSSQRVVREQTPDNRSIISEEVRPIQSDISLPSSAADDEQAADFEEDDNSAGLMSPQSDSSEVTSPTSASPTKAKSKWSSLKKKFKFKKKSSDNVVSSPTSADEPGELNYDVEEDDESEEARRASFSGPDSTNLQADEADDNQSTEAKKPKRRASLGALFGKNKGK